MRRFLLLFTAFVIALTLTGCGKKKKEETTAPTRVKGEKTYVFALVPKSVGSPYWSACEEGMKEACKELGVEGYFVGPETTDVEKQIRIIEDFVSKKVDGIAISPNDPTAITPVIDKILSQGIPVITFDSDAPKSKRLCYIGTDNYKAGYAAGEEMIKVLGGKGEIAIMTGSLGAYNLNERIRGFRDAIKKAPGIKEVTLQANNDDEELCFSQAENVLQAHPNLAGFFGVSGTGGPGSARAVKAAGKVGKVKIVCFDTVPMTVQFIKEGVIQATIAQKPKQMGYLAVKTLYQLAKSGKLEKLPDIDTGITVVTKENVSEFETPQ
ncbi:sugar-binding protein [bacterium]|nr:sugar-binding protein [bacterium]